MKQLLFALLVILGFSAKGQTWTEIYGRYGHQYDRSDSLFRPPLLLNAIPNRSVGQLYYNSADSNMHVWTGWNDNPVGISTYGANGITVSSGIANFGGTFSSPSQLASDRELDDSTHFQYLWFKTSPMPGAVFNLNKIGQFYIGEGTHIPAARNTNYTNDSHAPISSPLVIDRISTVSQGFNSIPFLTMTSGDGLQLNGFFFENQSNIQGEYFPNLYTFCNQIPRIGSQIHGYQHIAYVKQPINTTWPQSTAYVFSFDNLDLLDTANAPGGEVDSINVFAFETGSKHPMLMDYLYNLRVGDPGSEDNITVPAHLELIGMNGSAYGLLQEDSSVRDVMAGRTIFGGNGGQTQPTDIPSAQLAVESLTRGFLPPCMTTTQKLAIVNPAEGIHVYDLTLHQGSYYNGTAWINY